MSEHYTLGYARSALAFVGRRRLETHGAFFQSQLQPALRVLDCGCGPGSMTCDIAAAVAPGEVIDLQADRLREEGDSVHARILDDWARAPGVMFAEAWVSCIAIK